MANKKRIRQGHQWGDSIFAETSHKGDPIYTWFLWVITELLFAALTEFNPFLSNNACHHDQALDNSRPNDEEK